jgi:hypothetical protein
VSIDAGIGQPSGFSDGLLALAQRIGYVEPVTGWNIQLLMDFRGIIVRLSAGQF